MGGVDACGSRAVSPPLARSPVEVTCSRIILCSNYCRLWSYNQLGGQYGLSPAAILAGISKLHTSIAVRVAQIMGVQIVGAGDGLDEDGCNGVQNGWGPSARTGARHVLRAHPSGLWQATDPRSADSISPPLPTVRSTRAESLSRLHLPREYESQLEGRVAGHSRPSSRLLPL
ncbi:unnamed protein product [Sphagnum balticum]